MARTKARGWLGGLDNLGNNLIRLGSSLKSLERDSVTLRIDTAFAASVRQLGQLFSPAFRQAYQVLLANEEAFVSVATYSSPGTPPKTEEGSHPEQARTLVHEAILGARELVLFLSRVQRAVSVDATMGRQILQESLHSLGGSLVSTGWAVRHVCQEYDAELGLLGHAPGNLGEFGPGAVGLVHDMGRTARQLRSARREWFVVDQRIAAALGVEPSLEESPNDEPEAG